ncbi:hypothetical protein C6500_00005 [Candidatus Poribacteria bacterium]|nr:MAG: hypothetical protein C6500_00005 [Candidatus Poribacteria bacterium]
MKHQEKSEEVPSNCCMDPNARHNFKTFSLRLNEWENTQLAAAAEETGRSKGCFIRWAIREQAKKVL